MADIKISELTQVSALNNGDLVEVSQVNALAPSGYTSLKASMTDLGKKVNSDIEYTTDLADFTDKTITGAIKETAKGKNVADEYDDTQTYDKGDVVIYKNTLYICNTNNTTGTWDATKWTATTVQSLIGDLSDLTTSDTSSLVGAVNEVNGKTTVKNITSSSKVSGVEGGYIKMGNLVIVSVDFTLAQTATVGESLFSGLPMPKANDTSLSMYQTVYPPNATNVGARVFGANGSGNLYANTALNTTNNKYHIFGIYKDNS